MYLRHYEVSIVYMHNRVWRLAIPRYIIKNKSLKKDYKLINNLIQNQITHNAQSALILALTSGKADFLIQNSFWFPTAVSLCANAATQMGMCIPIY